MEPGHDPTKYCDDCAHLVAEELETENAKLKKGIQEGALLIAQLGLVAQAVQKHLPALKSMAGQIIHPENNTFRRMVNDFEEVLK